jgi:short subunit dehydrogenase-like uncharacterized protein
VVLFGATGYTGGLTASALVARGVRPVLAGRAEPTVRALAERLGGLEYAVADVDDPSSVRALVGRGDVLVSTVGPFQRWGRPAVEAAVAVGAHYVDTTGEPPFIRSVFETWSAPARDAGSTLLTAMGYDYVPGNLAASLALAEAEAADGGPATAVDVGYFVEGPTAAGAASGGTRASLAGVLFEAGFARRGGALVREPLGVRYRRFALGDRTLSGLSVGGSEHVTLPQSFPRLQDVGVYLGGFGPLSPALSLLARTGGRLVAGTRLRGPATRGLRRLTEGASGGPDEATRARFATLVVAEARDARRRLLSRVVVGGRSPYDFTAQFVAWAAEEAARGRLSGPGALGPTAAFGLERFQAGAAEAGVTRTDLA